MKRTIAWWAHNPVAANLLMIGILLSGWLGFIQMDREIIPVVRLGTVEISVNWPGAAPQEVEQQVILRIEQAVKGIDNLASINATAIEGMGQIIIEANSKADIAVFINQLKSRIDAISSFPTDIEPPQVKEVTIRTELVQIAVHGFIDEKKLKRLAESYRDEIALLPGVSVVELVDTRVEEISIELSAQAMRRFNLTFDQVAKAIQSSSINVASGILKTENGDIQLRSENQAFTEEDFNQIIIQQPLTGGIVRLSDIAKVVDGFVETPQFISLNGEPSVMIQVMSSDNTDVVKISRAVNQWMQDKQQNSGAGANLTLWWDAANIYQDRMATIGSSAISGLILVFIVLMLSLRAKIALWVTFGLATAYAGTFALLPASDVSINILSTFAFLLVLGIVVDDAIVVGESIHEQSDDTGGGNQKGAVLGAQLVAKPVVFAVLTTMIAFLPWFFLTGEDAQVTRHISIVIVLALTFSLIEAFFILPAHLANLKPRTKDNFLSRAQQSIELGIIKFAHTSYRNFLNKILNNYGLTTSLFIGLFIISVGLLSSGWVKFSFMPEIENDKMTVEVKLAEGTGFARSMQVHEQIEAATAKLSAQVNSEKGKFIENVYTKVAEASISSTLRLTTPDNRTISSKQAAELWKQQIGSIPDAEQYSVYFNSNRDADVEFTVTHNDYPALSQAVEQLKTQLRTYTVVSNVRDNLANAGQELQINLKPGAKRYGLTLGEISRQVRQAYFGEEIQRLPRDGSDIKVMLRFPELSRRSLDSLADFRVSTNDGVEVSLLAVAELEYQSGLQRIDRKEGRRSVVVSADLQDNVRYDIDGELEESFFPQWYQDNPGVSLGDSGIADAEKTFFLELLSLYLIALFLMYTLIAVAFQSYRQPLLIMVAIPFSFMGAVYGHLIYDMPMALFSYFGIGAAAGVVVNDNLVLMDYINRLKNQGVNIREAIIEAGVKRFRPIILTSLTTFVGLLPMMAENSVQAQFLQPTVVSLAFGVLFASFITLLLVPALYLVGLDFIAFCGRFKTHMMFWKKKTKKSDQVLVNDV